MKSCVAAACAFVLTGPGTPYYAGMPPEHLRGPATVVVKVVRPERLVGTCGSTVPPGLELKGCAKMDWLGRTHIVLPDPCLRGEIDETARILCHEISHAAHGWPGDHPL